MRSNAERPLPLIRKDRGGNCLEAFDKGIKGGVGDEIRNRHDFVSLYPSGQGSLTDDKVRIGGNGVDGAVGAGNPVEVVFQQFRLEPGCPESAGSHTRITGENNLPDGSGQAGRDWLSRSGRLGSVFILPLEIRPGLDHRYSQQERHGRSDQYAQDPDQGPSPGGHQDNRNQAARRSGRNESEVRKRIERKGADIADHHGKEQNRTRQDIREIDFMDPAKQLDHRGSGSGLLRHSLSEDPAGEKDSQTRSRIRIDEEKHGLSHLGGLLDTERGHDSVVDGVVQEKDLRRIDQHGQQRVHLVGKHPVDPAAEQVRQPFDHMPDQQVSRNGEEHRDDPKGEIIHEHFESGSDLALDQFVEALDAPAGQRAHQHGPEEHGRIGSDNYAHRGDGSGDSAPISADILAGRKGDQGRQQIFEHRRNHLRQMLVRPPAPLDEQGRDQAPRDERADIRHDHRAETPPETLDLLLYHHELEFLDLVIRVDDFPYERITGRDSRIFDDRSFQAEDLYRGKHFDALRVHPVIEMQGGTDGKKDFVIGKSIALGRHHRKDKPVVRSQLPERFTSDPVDVVAQVRIGETLDNPLDIGVMDLMVETEFLDQAFSALAHDGADKGTDLRVGNAVSDCLETLHLSDISGRRMACIEGKEFPFDIGLEVIDRGHAFDRRNLPDEGRPLYIPFIILFHRNVERNFAADRRDDPVDGGIRPTDVGLSPLPDILGKEVKGQGLELGGRPEAVLTGNDIERFFYPGGFARGETLGNRRGDEFQDTEPDSRRNQVGIHDFCDGVVAPGIDGLDVFDCDVTADGIHHMDGILFPRIDLPEKVGDDVREDDFEPGLREDGPDETAADIACSELYCFHRDCLFYIMYLQI